jgi:hypothetical protein
MFYVLSIMDVFFEKRRFLQAQAGVLQQKGRRKIKKTLVISMMALCAEAVTAVLLLEQGFNDAMGSGSLANRGW